MVELMWSLGPRTILNFGKVEQNQIAQSAQWEFGLDILQDAQKHNYSLQK
jgi:hypothetical protein